MNVSVVLREDLGRYEVLVGGHTAGFVEFRDVGGVREFTNSQVDAEFEGRGLGSTLMAQTLDAERAAGRRIRPRCPFAKRFIERNPEYRDLVAPRAVKPRP
jgi:uncharacterized protein